MRLKSRSFKETFDVLKAFKELDRDSLTFKFDTYGFAVENTSRDMVAYLKATFKASGFDEFEVGKYNRKNDFGEDITVDLKNFLDFTFNRTDKITITTDDKRMSLSAESDTMTNLSLPLLDNQTENPNVPIDTMKANTSLIELDFNAFKTILKNYLKEDSITLDLNSDRLIINTGRGQETKIFKGTDIIKEIRGLAKSKYSIEFLKLLNKLDAKTFTNIKIEFKTDFPIIFTLENDNIKVEYMIAPRINQDE